MCNCVCQQLKGDTFKSIDDQVRAFHADYNAQTAIQSTIKPSPIDRVVKIYSGVKPLLTVLASLNVFPFAWRSAISILMGALDALSTAAVAVPDTVSVNADFKAGKDL